MYKMFSKRGTKVCLFEDSLPLFFFFYDVAEELTDLALTAKVDFAVFRNFKSTGLQMLDNLISHNEEHRVTKVILTRAAASPRCS